MNAKNRVGAWRVAAAVIAAAGLIGSVEAQQGRRGAGSPGNRGPRPAAAPKQDEPAKQPRPAAAPRPQSAPKPKPAASQPRPAAPRQAPPPAQAKPRPATPPPAPKQTAPPPPPPPPPKVTPPAPAPKPVKAAPPAPKPAAPAPPPKVTAPAPKPAAPAPVPAPAPAPAPKVNRPAPKPNAPAPEPKITARAPKPVTPVAPRPAPKFDKPAPKATPPAVVVKRPTVTKPKAPDAVQPKRPDSNPDKPKVVDRDRKPPVVSLPPRVKPDAPKITPPVKSPGTGSGPKILKPTNGLVKAAPIASTPVNPVGISPVPQRQPQSGGGGGTVNRSRGLVRAAAAAGPAVVFNENATHDSGLLPTNSLVRPVYESPVYDNGWYDNSCGPTYIVSGYTHGDYRWRTRSYVSYSSGYCAPARCAPTWPRWGTSIYTSYDPWCSTRYYVPCPPTYVAYCGPTYTYCPPTSCTPSYCGDSWGISFGFSSSSSWFGINYSSGWWSSPSYYRSYDCWSPCYRPYRYVNPCSGWWRRPAWGWSTYSCDPWSCIEPRGPVYPFPVYETTGAIGLTEAASVTIDPAEQLEEAVYSTMRGRYETAIQTTRSAVIDAPELFAPGQTDLDKYQMQRAKWALTVYENPPQAAVEQKDAAFMVAAIAALAGDHDRAAEAVAEARDLGDDHPATLRLIEQLAMEDARADWGIQTTAR